MPLTTHKKNRLRLLIPILLVLLFFSLIPQTQKRAPWYEQMLANLVSPVQCVFTSLSQGVHSVWDGYFSLVGAKGENTKLLAENARIKGELVRVEEIQRENERLRGLLGYKESFDVRSVSARVIANDPRAEFKSLMIDRGQEDGIALYMPVVGPRGLVGRVGRVSEDTALVLLLNDPNCAVDAMIQRSRARGLLVGAVARTKLKSGQYLTRLEYLRRVSDVRDGDVVVTSGLDQVFPPGLPIGTVHDIARSKSGIFKEAEVVPFENFAELQEIMVLLYKAKG
jgi:rod shape-determining protein MreC